MLWWSKWCPICMLLLARVQMAITSAKISVVRAFQSTVWGCFSLLLNIPLLVAVCLWLMKFDRTNNNPHWKPKITQNTAHHWPPLLYTLILSAQSLHYNCRQKCVSFTAALKQPSQFIFTLNSPQLSGMVVGTGRMQDPAAAPQKRFVISAFLPLIPFAGCNPTNASWKNRWQ